MINIFKQITKDKSFFETKNDLIFLIDGLDRLDGNQYHNLSHLKLNTINGRLGYFHMMYLNVKDNQIVHIKNNISSNLIFHPKR